MKIHMKYQASLFLFFMLTLFAQAQHQSLNFDGADDAVSLGNVLNFDITDTFAIQVWVKQDPGQPDQQIISKLDSNYRGWGLAMSYGAPTIFFVDNLGQDQVLAYADVSINDSQWHSITVNHLGNGLFFFIVDSAFATVITNDMGAVDSVITDANAMIGASDLSNQPMEFFKGNFDELRIWDTVIGPGQLYDMSKELTGNEPHLIGYYKFDHANASCDVVDYSSSGNHGVRQGVQGNNNLPQFSIDIPTITAKTPPAMVNCSLVGLPETRIGSLNIYPNPSNGVFNIELEYDELTSLSITNMHGAVVTQVEFEGSQYSCQHDLPKGHYLITVSQKSAVYHSRIVIN